MKSLFVLSIFSLLATAVPVNASQVDSATYQGNGKFSSSPTPLLLPIELASAPALRIHLPLAPVPEALRELNQVGYPVSLPESHASLVDLEAENAWIIIGNKKYARVTIEVPQALGLRAEVLISAEFKGTAYWTESSANSIKIAQNANGSWTPISQGSHLDLLIELENKESFKKNNISIPQISIIDSDLSQKNSFSSIYQTTSSCTVDLACASSPQVRYQGKSVAKLDFVKNGKSYICSGTILNDKNSTFTPYLFTANHCIDSQAVADTLVTTWNLEYSGCYKNNSGTPGGSTRLQGGADLLHSDYGNDHAFLRLRESTPPGTLYSGWNSSPVDSFTSIFSINHPIGDVKKVTFGSVAYPSTATVTSSGNTRAGMLSVGITTGEVQGGSSGGGVFSCTAQGCQLRGAISSGGMKPFCSSTQAVFASRFDRAFPYIKQWLESAPNHLESFSFSSWPNSIEANTSIPTPEIIATYSNGEKKNISPTFSSSNNNILWFSDRKIYTGTPLSDATVTVTATYPEQGKIYSNAFQITVKTTIKPLTSNIDCLFDWAERQYATELPSTGKSKSYTQPYTCRQYPENSASICASESDPYLYYKGPLSIQLWQNLGPLKTWYNTSSCTNL